MCSSDLDRYAVAKSKGDRCKDIQPSVALVILMSIAESERLAGIEALRPPQRTMEDKIASALMGMGSSRYLGFGIANAAQQERAAQEAERARNMEIHNQIMDIKQKGLDLTRANLNAALTAGNEAYKETLQGKAKGLEVGSNIHKAEIGRAHV